jgi:hypothetical protein
MATIRGRNNQFMPLTFRGTEWAPKNGNKKLQTYMVLKEEGESFGFSLSE